MSRTVLKTPANIADHMDARNVQHVAFTGCHHGMTPVQQDAVRLVLTTLLPVPIGQCLHVAPWPGADTEVQSIASLAGWQVEMHPKQHGRIDWLQPGWLLIAAPGGREASCGTWNNVEAAAKARLPAVVIYDDGVCVLITPGQGPRIG